MELNFEWDPDKATTNARKHGVTFEQAAAIFCDPLALTIYDTDNSTDIEDRWITLGQISDGRLLVAIHTYRSSKQGIATIRLISARPATKNEIKQYER